MPYSSKDKQKAWYLNNKDKVREYRKLNRLRILEQKREYRKRNASKLVEKQRVYVLEHGGERNSYLRKWTKIKRTTDPIFKIKETLRRRLNNAIKRGQKSGSAVRDLGCSIPEFKTYIEQQFSEGMSWSNHGEWHLDHKVPLASFDLTNREEFLRAVHYSNYQPLWALDNLKKGAKVYSSV